MADSQVSRKDSRGALAPLVRGNDARCGTYWAEDEAGSEQLEDGPTYVVIGRGAPDDKLQKLAQRHGFTVEQLQAFRDSRVP
jgi:hypothetical protein